MLDLDDDPTPGDTGRILSLSKRFLDFADVADQARRSVASLQSDDGVLSWVGTSGDAFREEFGDFPGQLQKLYDSHQMAGDALVAYAPKLSTAQAQADRALADGRTARDLLTSLAPQVDTATSESVTSSQRADQVQRSQSGASAPDPEQVRQALRDATTAQDHLTALQGQVNTAQQALDTAKSLADQARQLRDTAADECVKKIHEASDAGIKPRSFWEKLGDFFSTVWDGICEIAKWVALVAGVIALIIGGPLAWVAFGAGVVLLVDVFIDIAQGEFNLLELVFAILGVIPAIKGLTSLAKLSELYQKGGLAEIGRAALNGLRNMVVDAAKALGLRGGRTATGALDDIESVAAMDDLDSVAVMDDLDSVGSADWLGDTTSVLDDIDRQALRNYTTNLGCSWINGYLRGNPELSGSFAESLRLPQRADEISTALAKLPSTPGVTYRGATYSDELLANYNVGQIVTERAFTSTSADILVADNFSGNTLITITGRNGKEISGFSDFAHESEVLYDKGTQFKVIDKVFDEESQRWLITMQEV
ncbi:ADP-ribosyltransferase [Actinoplanes sp. NPDC051851]|uniref:ADP-ribosyltransferase n=1 Tax=Actinoplanes sp. NPDC051851 TaxID=3154753 RepID=UPI00342D5797